jgi:hypothetical protein
VLPVSDVVELHPAFEDVELLELTSPGQYKTIDTVNGKEVATATA